MGHVLDFGQHDRRIRHDSGFHRNQQIYETAWHEYLPGWMPPQGWLHAIRMMRVVKTGKDIAKATV